MSRRDRDPEIPHIDNRNAAHLRARHHDDEANFSVEELDEALDKLTEKRATTREEGLHVIYNMLSHEFRPQAVSHNPMTLGDGLLRSITSSTTSEAVLACRVLSLVAITVGAVDSDFGAFDDAISSLSSRLASLSSRTEAVVRSYIETLAVLVFATGSESSEHETLELFLSLATRSGLAVVQDALNAWSLIVSGVSSSYVCGTIIPDNLQSIINILYSSTSTDVRIAAGEAVSLLVEIYRDSREDEGVAFDLSDLSGFADIDELQDRLQELQRETTHSISKTALAEQRRQFRRITASLEGSAQPSEKFVTNSSVLPIVVDGWAAHHQLRYFRALFEGRLIEHMCHNPLLPNVLNYEPQELSRHQWQELSTYARQHAYSHSSAAKKKHTRSRIRLRSDKGSLRDSDTFVDDE